MKKTTLTPWYKQITKLSLCALALTCAFPMAAHADNSSDKIVKSIEDLRDKLLNWHDNSMQQHITEMHAPDAYQPAAQTANTALPALTDALRSAIDEEVGPKLRVWLQGMGNATERRVKLLSIEASDSFYFRGSPPPGNKQAGANNSALGSTGFHTEAGLKSQGDKQKKPPGEANFDFGTIISVSGYEDKAASDTAKHVIQFLMASVEPLSSVDLSKLTNEQRKTFESSQGAMDYKIYMRSLAAQLSLSLNNLLNIYTHRIKIPDAGTKVGMKDAQGAAVKDASIEEVEEYIATHRTKDANWYTAMSQASPAAVNREMLFVMAEMEKQLYQLHKDNERLIATLSVMQLQNIQMSKALNKGIEDKAASLVTDALQAKPAQ